MTPEAPNPAPAARLTGICHRELTVLQNLVLHARLFQVPEPEIPARVSARFRKTISLMA